MKIRNVASIQFVKILKLLTEIKLNYNKLKLFINIKKTNKKHILKKTKIKKLEILKIKAY